MFNEQLQAEDYQAIQEAQSVMLKLSAIIFYIDAIEGAETKDEVEVFLSCLEEAEAFMPKSWRAPGKTRERIKAGYGDFSKIQKKCIEMGVV